jgi:hypothetical protein
MGISKVNDLRSFHVINDRNKLLVISKVLLHSTCAVQNVNLIPVYCRLPKT